jgi:hypothetical protein
MNAYGEYGDIGNYGMVPYGAYSGKKKGKKGKKRRPAKIRQKLFDKFARQYGTQAFPAWSNERAACIKAYLRKNADDDCTAIVREMRSVEYPKWLRQGLQQGQLKGAEQKAAKAILGRGENGAVEENGRSKRSQDKDGGGFSGPSMGFVFGALLLAGGGYWWYKRSK